MKTEREISKKIGQGTPMRDTHLFKHYSSNKPMVCLLFKIEPTKKQQLVQGTKMCNDSTPMSKTRHTEKMVKESIQIVQNMKFTKMSSKVHCLLSSIPESFNVSINMSEDYRVDLQNETPLAQDMEDNTLLQDTLLSNNVLHGRETVFGVF